jgi:hypothetical protein
MIYKTTTRCTFQLIDLMSRQTISLDGQTYSGPQLYQQILQQMRSTVGAAPYNKLYRPQQDGVATTFAGFIAPALGIADPYHATPDQVAAHPKGTRARRHGERHAAGGLRNLGVGPCRRIASPGGLRLSVHHGRRLALD